LPTNTMADAPEVVPTPPLEPSNDSQRNLTPRKSVPQLEKARIGSYSDKYPVESVSDLIPVHAQEQTNDDVHELAVYPQRKETLDQQEPFIPRAIEPDDGDQIVARAVSQPSQSQIRLNAPTGEWKFGFWDLCGNGSVGTRDAFGRKTANAYMLIFMS
jgi:hypothetical protein